MRPTHTTIIAALGVVIVIALGGTYAEPGHVYLAVETDPDGGNGGYTGYIKIGWTKPHVTKDQKIAKMKTYNPRPIQIVEYIEVTNRVAAEQAALASLRQIEQWSGNAGGGTEWFWINMQNGSPDWRNFHKRFLDAIAPYRVGNHHGIGRGRKKVF